MGYATGPSTGQELTLTGGKQMLYGGAVKLLTTGVKGIVDNNALIKAKKEVITTSLDTSV